MTRTPAWKAARAERRMVERDALEQRRTLAAEIRKASALRYAFDQALASIDYADPNGSKTVYINGEPRDAGEFARVRT